jgi:hypothetical protein
MNRLILICFACLPALTSAQDAASKKEPLLRFTSFGLKDGGGEYVLSVGAKQTQPFAIPDNSFSPPVAAPAAAATIALGKAAEPPFRSLVTLKIPDNGRRFLVILLPGENDSLRAIVIPADDPAFRSGQVMILNLAAEPLAADLGDEKQIFPPGSQTIFRPQRKNDLANYQVRFFQSREGKPKLFAANLWPYFEDKRAFVFLYTDPASGSPTYRSIDEFTDWLEKTN